MSEPYFNTQTQQDRLRLEACGWLGTPFFEACGGGAIKGVRADCLWVAAPLQRLGAIGAIAWPERYVSRGGGPQMLELLLSLMRAVPGFECVWTRTSGAVAPEVLCGDVLVVSTGTRLHHLLLYIGQQQTLHCWAGKVRLGSLQDQRKLWYAIFRPVGAVPV